LCPPGEIGCDASRRFTLTCAVNGLEIVRTTDCNAAGQICADGVCLPVECTANQLFCIGNASYECDHTGTASTFLEECGVRQYCDTDSGTCKNQDCAPGQTRCEGNVVIACDGNGQGSSTMDCGDSDQSCFEGECLPTVCNLGDTSCGVNNEILECIANGTATQSTGFCLAAQYCDPGDGTSAICVPDVCEQGEPACIGSLAGTCNASGSGLEPGSQDCGAPSFEDAGPDAAATPTGGCYNGVCACQPGESWCIDGDAWRCSYNLASDMYLPRLSQTCADDCRPIVCYGDEPCGGAECVDCPPVGTTQCQVEPVDMEDELLVSCTTTTAFIEFCLEGCVTTGVDHCASSGTADAGDGG
jgi:hypothetical protein